MALPSIRSEVVRYYHQKVAKAPSSTIIYYLAGAPISLTRLTTVSAPLVSWTILGRKMYIHVRFRGWADTVVHLTEGR